MTRRGRCPCNFIALEHFCKEEQNKIAKLKCAKLVGSYPITLSVFILQGKDVLTLYGKMYVAHHIHIWYLNILFQI